MRTRNRVLFLFTATMLAQQPPPAPSFHTGTKLVEVDVIARDRKGPAAGLTKQDFTLFDNGMPQEIAVFSVKQSSAKPARAPAAAKDVLPAGVVSNRVDRNGEAPGAVTVVLLDQQNVPVNRQSDAIGEIGKFIESRRKQDRVAIYTLQKDGLHLVQDLTGDDGLLRAAAKKLRPAGPQRCDSAAEDCPLRLALETKHAFEAIARHLANVPGRKSVIWITTSFPLLIVSPVHYDFTEDMQAAARILSDAHIALYSVAMHGLTVNGRGVYPPGFNTMDFMGELTGGEVFINTNDIAGSIEAATEDDDLVYTLGFYPPSEDDKGGSHKLKVEVSRKGLSLRYRGSYVAADTQTAAFDPKNVEQLLKDSLDAAQIELAANATPDKTHAGSYQVHVAVNLHDVQFQHQGAVWVAELGVGFLVQGTDAFRVITRKIELPDSQLAAGLDKGTLIETSIALQAPAGVLRIAVQDQATGAAGSLHVPLGGK
jgi:VWFA-related protein